MDTIVIRQVRHGQQQRAGRGGVYMAHSAIRDALPPLVESARRQTARVQRPQLTLHLRTGAVAVEAKRQRAHMSTALPRTHVSSSARRNNSEHTVGAVCFQRLHASVALSRCHAARSLARCAVQWTHEAGCQLFSCSASVSSLLVVRASCASVRSFVPERAPGPMFAATGSRSRRVVQVPCRPVIPRRPSHLVSFILRRAQAHPPAATPLRRCRGAGKRAWLSAPASSASRRDLPLRGWQRTRRRN